MPTAYAPPSMWETNFHAHKQQQAKIMWDFRLPLRSTAVFWFITNTCCVITQMSAVPNRQNYSSVYFNVYIFGQQIGRRNILDWLVAGFPWVVCSEFLLVCDFNFLWFPHFLTLPHLRGIHFLCVYFDVGLHSVYETWKYALFSQHILLDQSPY